MKINFKVIQFLILLIPSICLSDFSHDHTELKNLLDTYVKITDDGISLFDYKLLKTKGLKNLIEYTESISSIKEKDFDKFSESEKLSFLLNAYNSFLIKAIVNNFPLRSVNDLKMAGLSLEEYKYISLFSSTKNLKEIEELIYALSPKVNSFFGINRGNISSGCIQYHAFTSDTVYSVLEESRKSFFNTTACNKVDIEKNTAVLSSFIDPQRGFFKAGDLESFRRDFLSKINSETKLVYLDYDDSLNSM